MSFSMVIGAVGLLLMTAALPGYVAMVSFRDDSQFYIIVCLLVSTLFAGAILHGIMPGLSIHRVYGFSGEWLAVWAFLRMCWFIWCNGVPETRFTFWLAGQLGSALSDETVERIFVLGYYKHHK